jgi:tectonic-1/3
VITEVHYNFLYAKVGQFGNAQKKIVGASVKYVEQDITFRCLGSSCNPTATQLFELKAIITFEDSSSDSLKDQIPGPPPIIPKLPKDIFYPFIINGVEKYSASWFITIVILIIMY